MPIFKGPIMASVADHMEQMELPSIACGFTVAQSLWKTVLNTFTISPAISFLYLYPRGKKAQIHTKTCTHVFIISSMPVNNLNLLKYPSTAEWISKFWCFQMNLKTSQIQKTTYFNISLLRSVIKSKTIVTEKQIIEL